MGILPPPIPHPRVHLHFFLFDMSFDSARHVCVKTRRQVKKLFPPLEIEGRKLQSSVLECGISKP